MATSELTRPTVSAPPASEERGTGGVRHTVILVLKALSSLRLTVALFALSIFLILAGTLAQVDHGIWYVVDHAYFRVWIAQIDLRGFERLVQMFYPVQWNLTHVFLFPGGKLIGGLLLINLLAAHGVRFRIAAQGRRLAAGLAVTGLGVLITVLVIRGGMDESVASELSPLFCDRLWLTLQIALGVLALAGAYMLVFGYRRMRRFEWWLLLTTDVLLAVLAVWIVTDPAARLDAPGLRILWQLIQGAVAGSVLLAGCVIAFRQRAGIVLLHGGVALLMFSELWTGLRAQESRMSITEGQTVNYSQDIRTTEMAVSEHVSPGEDVVTVVPASLLAANVSTTAAIEHDDLPFEIRVYRWLPNSQPRAPNAGESNPATAGFGLQRVAEEIPRTSGIDADAPADMPAAYVELLSKSNGESLGTYLVSQWLPEQPVEVDGRTYDLALRFKRIYWPYSLTLRDFSFDRYQGTNVPKNYSSDVVLKDPERNVDRDVKIWMNNPLRYAGTTFYQSGFDPETEQATVLQVVTNAGWMIPYVSCMLVLMGMVAHFGVGLVRFSRRRMGQVARAGARSGWALWFPAIVVAIFAVYVASHARMPKSEPSEMQIYEFGKLPLAYQGRIKPYDTLARNTLQIFRGRQQVGVIDSDGKVVGRVPAIRWLLDAISGAEAANEHRVFRIDNLELLDTLGLEPRPGFFCYSLAELRDQLDELDKQTSLALAQPEDQRSLYQVRVLELSQKLSLYAVLKQAFQPPRLRAEQEHFAEDLQRIQQDIQRLQSSSAPHAVPPKTADGRWKTLMEAEMDLLHDRAMSQSIHPATVALATLLSAYAQGNETTFNKQLADYRQLLTDYEGLLTAHAGVLREAGMANSEILSQSKVDFEVFYNHFSPFYYAAVLYLVAFVLGALSWVGWTEPLRRSSMWLLWMTFALHTFALVARIYISGRPPVTNLYSTAIFIGWGGVLLALVFEMIYRLGLGNIAAAVIGFLTLLVAYNLSLDGDTFIVLQAVLDTQFWLATHVVTINLGYAATYATGLWGALYILLAHVFPVLEEDGRRNLLRVLYGTLCFAILFSFVGTVLGGLWADDSWGRFWGWDPKENGALIIVLWNALVLHARWGGIVKGRGLAVLAVCGNIATTWSYFGVNELGVGLHSYGASDRTTAMWLLAFTASQLVLIVLGTIPPEWFGTLKGRANSASP